MFNKLYFAHPKMRVFWKLNTPFEWAIRNGRFSAPLLVVADPGWVIALVSLSNLFFSLIPLTLLFENLLQFLLSLTLYVWLLIVRHVAIFVKSVIFFIKRIIIIVNVVG